MNNSNFKYILILIGLSSLGIILFQLNWLKESYEVTQKNFDESALQSLRNTINELDLYRSARTIHAEGNNNVLYNYNSGDSLFRFSFFSFSKFDFIPNYDDKFYDKLAGLQDQFEQKRSKDHKFFEYVTVIYAQIDSTSSNDYLEVQIDSVLGKNLRSNNIQLKHTFGFKNVKENTWDYIGGEKLTDTTLLEKSVYRIEPLDGNENVYLIFYDKKSFLYRSLLNNIIISAILVLITLFSFWYALRIILRQKRLSQIKTDFINNMTHEFKTPLATIGMATATIEEPDVIKNEKVVKQFTQVIKDENERMNKQIEMVLKIAQDDHRLSKLNKTEVDIDTLIASIVSHNRLRLEKGNGSIEYAPKEKNVVIIVDEVNIYQAINNLVDNAIKYSGKNIDIKITSKIKGDYFILSIADKGIGIKKQDEKKIFEKFYRVSTKDVHNVKGFGLGLNYVKQITEAHNGYVTLQHNKVGSTFSLHLPINKK